MAASPSSSGPSTPAALADVGVFGGSGLYSFLDAVDEIEVATPYGPPASPVTIARVGDRRVAFLPRHGRSHQFPAHVVPYRANVWAMHHLGVRAIVGPCAVGSLQPDLRPGDMVVVDQLVDRTWGRPSTYFDGPELRHLTFADPYDSALRACLVAAASELGVTVHDGGTMVVIQGPRFSTRAESAANRREGWQVVNMTGAPEAGLAAELGIPYAALALVTDYDAGVQGDEGVPPVTQELVLAMLAANARRVTEVLAAAIPTFPMAPGAPPGGPRDIPD